MRLVGKARVEGDLRQRCGPLAQAFAGVVDAQALDVLAETALTKAPEGAGEVERADAPGRNRRDRDALAKVLGRPAGRGAEPRRFGRLVRAHRARQRAPRTAATRPLRASAARESTPRRAATRAIPPVRRRAPTHARAARPARRCRTERRSSSTMKKRAPTLPMRSRCGQGGWVIGDRERAVAQRDAVRSLLVLAVQQQAEVRRLVRVLVQHPLPGMGHDREAGVADGHAPRVAVERAQTERRRRISLHYAILPHRPVCGTGPATESNR